MFRKVTNIAAISAAVLIVAAVGIATAATEQSHLAAGMPSGYLSINPQTCKFVHPEIDKREGPTWKGLRTAFNWEDARHDAKLVCLTNALKRSNAIARCFSTPIPSVAERVDHKGGWADTKGVGAAVAALQRIQACVAKASVV